MRILECIHSLQPGGAERFVVELSNQLSKQNEVMVLTLKNRDSQNENFYLNELSHNIVFKSLNFNNGFRLLYLYKVYKLIKEYKPDIVHIHCILQYLVLAILLCPKCKYIQTLHNKAESGIPPKIKLLTKALLKFKRLKMVTISDINRNSFRNYFHLNNDVLIYNGRSEPHKTSLFLETKLFINSIKSTDSDLILLSVARCHKQKNLQLLIQATNKLVQNKIPIKLLIIGDGYDNELGKQWKSLACDSIYFLGPRNNIADYFFLSDAFCLSSLYEGMPITLIESLACKCIPLSTPVSGILDIIRDGQNGFISKSFELEDYVEMLMNFIKKKDNIEKDNLYSTYKRFFSIEKCASKYIATFNSLQSE